MRIFADYEYLVYYITVFAENKIFWKNISIPHGETDFKSVLRKRLFESGANKKSGILQFQRLSDMELDMVSAAGDMDFLRQQEQKDKKDKNQ